MKASIVTQSGIIKAYLRRKLEHKFTSSLHRYRNIKSDEMNPIFRHSSGRTYDRNPLNICRSSHLITQPSLLVNVSSIHISNRNCESIWRRKWKRVSYSIDFNFKRKTWSYGLKVWNLNDTAWRHIANKIWVHVEYCNTGKLCWIDLIHTKSWVCCRVPNRSLNSNDAINLNYSWWFQSNYDLSVLETYDLTLRRYGH